MDISCIIVNWNTKDLTIHAVRSILSNSPSHLRIEVIVVDNASSDGSEDALSQTFSGNPNVTILTLPKNIGYGPALNRGADIATGEWIFYLNSDIVVLADCLAELHTAASHNPMAGLYSPRVLNADSSDQDVYGFLEPLRYSLFLKLFSRKKIDYANVKSNTVEFEAILGVAYFVHRDLVAMIGGWAEDYVMYAEDWDYCFRLYLQKKKCVLVRSARLIHFGQSSSSKKWRSEERDRVIEITRWMFARRYSQAGLYELMWFYALLKSIIRGHVLGVVWERSSVRAKFWFMHQLSIGYSKGLQVHLQRELEILCATRN